jgi:hypothetical protein
MHEHSLVVSEPKAASLDPAANLKRTENLLTCLNASEAFFSLFYDLDYFPISSYPHLSMATFIQISHCVVTLFRLSTFESMVIPWDTQKVRQKIDLGETLRLWAERFEAVPDETGMDPGMSSENNDSPWSHSPRAIKLIRKWWDNSGVAEGNVSVGEIASQQEIDRNESSMIKMDVFDDVWMRDMMGGEFDMFKEPYY